MKKLAQLQEADGLVLCVGPPKGGTSTILECLKAASETDMMVLPYSGQDSIALIERSLDQVPLVLADVQQGQIAPEDIQALVNAGLLWRNHGAVIRVSVPAETVLKRSSATNFQEQVSWRQKMLDVEDKIRVHSLAYFMISNYNLADAVKELALRCHLRK